jgi:hypothetical protein
MQQNKRSDGGGGGGELLNKTRKIVVFLECRYRVAVGGVC